MISENDIINLMLDILTDIPVKKTKFERDPKLDNSNDQEIVVNTISQNTSYADTLQLSTMVVNVNFYCPKIRGIVDTTITSYYEEEIRRAIQLYKGDTNRVGSYEFTTYPAYTRSLDENTSVTNIRIQSFFT